jgi:hypothetical protein
MVSYVFVTWVVGAWTPSRNVTPNAFVAFSAVAKNWAFARRLVKKSWFKACFFMIY